MHMVPVVGLGDQQGIITAPLIATWAAGSFYWLLMYDDESRKSGTRTKHPQAWRELSMDTTVLDSNLHCCQANPNRNTNPQHVVQLRGTCTCSAAQPHNGPLTQPKDLSHVS